MTGIDRREALALLASLGGLALVSSGVPLGAASSASLARFRDGLDAQAARNLGRTYLALRPEEADAQGLLDAIFDEAGSPRDLPARLSDKVRADFADGRVVDLADWQVSVTEARIFAVIALSA